MFAGGFSGWSTNAVNSEMCCSTSLRCYHTRTDLWVAGRPAPQKKNNEEFEGGWDAAGTAEKGNEEFAVLASYNCGFQVWASLPQYPGYAIMKHKSSTRSPQPKGPQLGRHCDTSLGSHAGATHKPGTATLPETCMAYHLLLQAVNHSTSPCLTLCSSLTSLLYLAPLFPLPPPDCPFPSPPIPLPSLPPHQ